MKRTLLVLSLIGAATLSGCSHQYVMRMSNGSKIVTAGEPKFIKDKGAYMYKDARGEKHYVSQGRVIEILPASDVKESKPKK